MRIEFVSNSKFTMVSVVLTIWISKSGFGAPDVGNRHCTERCTKSQRAVHVTRALLGAVGEGTILGCENTGPAVVQTQPGRSPFFNFIWITQKMVCCNIGFSVWSCALLSRRLRSFFRLKALCGLSPARGFADNWASTVLSLDGVVRSGKAKAHSHRKMLMYRRWRRRRFLPYGNDIARVPLSDEIIHEGFQNGLENLLKQKTVDVVSRKGKRSVTSFPFKTVTINLHLVALIRAQIVQRKPKSWWPLQNKTNSKTKYSRIMKK